VTPVALERVVDRLSKATSTTSRGAGRPSARGNNDNGSMMKISDVWPGDWSEPTGEKTGTE